jgi:hypothetical protein
VTCRTDADADAYAECNRTLLLRIEAAERRRELR